MPGPPLMLYLVAHPQPKAAARALSLSLFAVCYCAVAALNVLSGSVDLAMLVTTIVLSPAVIFGTWIGVRVSSHVSERAFRGAILALLILSGIGALWSGLTA